MTQCAIEDRMLWILPPIPNVLVEPFRYEAGYLVDLGIGISMLRLQKISLGS